MRVADVVLVASEGFNCLAPRGTSAVAPPWLYPRDHQFQLETGPLNSVARVTAGYAGRIVQEMHKEHRLVYDVGSPMWWGQPTATQP